MTDIMTPEEVEVFEKRIAETMLEKIKEQMLYKIISEHSARHFANVKKIIEANAATMVREELARREDELKQTIAKTVDRYISEHTALEVLVERTIRDGLHSAMLKMQHDMDKELSEFVSGMLAKSLGQKP